MDVKTRMGRIQDQLGQKQDKLDFETCDQSTKRSLDEINKSIALKSNIKDVCALLDMKSNIDDVNKALSEIHASVELKLGKTDYQEALQDQNAINEALCAENCVARWHWKSG